MKNTNHEQNYKQQLENILEALLNDFPKYEDFLAFFKDNLSATRLAQAVQLYSKIAKLNLQLKQEKEEHITDRSIRREELIQKVKKLIHP